MDNIRWQLPCDMPNASMYVKWRRNMHKINPPRKRIGPNWGANTIFYAGSIFFVCSPLQWIYDIVRNTDEEIKRVFCVQYLVRRHVSELLHTLHQPASVYTLALYGKRCKKLEKHSPFPLVRAQTIHPDPGTAPSTRSHFLCYSFVYAKISIFAACDSLLWHRSRPDPFVCVPLSWMFYFQVAKDYAIFLWSINHACRLSGLKWSGVFAGWHTHVSTKGKSIQWCSLQFSPG